MILERDVLRCKPWIEAALAKGNDTHDFIHIVDGVIAGQFQFWANDTSCVITEVIDYPKKRVLHVFLAGGDLAGIRQIEPNAIEWAKSIGCTDFTLSGRKGWLRELKSDGWKDLNQHNMVKRI